MSNYLKECIVRNFQSLKSGHKGISLNQTGRGETLFKCTKKTETQLCQDEKLRN